MLRNMMIAAFFVCLSDLGVLQHCQRALFPLYSSKALKGIAVCIHYQVFLITFCLHCMYLFVCCIRCPELHRATALPLRRGDGWKLKMCVVVVDQKRRILTWRAPVGARNCISDLGFTQSCENLCFRCCIVYFCPMFPHFSNCVCTCSPDCVHPWPIMSISDFVHRCLIVSTVV